MVGLYEPAGDGRAEQIGRARRDERLEDVVVVSSHRVSPLVTPYDARPRPGGTPA